MGGVYIIMNTKMSHKISLNKKIYPLSIIYKTSYIFLDRCYFFLDQDEDENVVVSLKLKQKQDPSSYESIVGEFQNELINQAVRVDVYQKTKSVRELILARALYSTSYVQEEGEGSSELSTREFDINSIAKDWFSNNEQ